MKKISYLLVVLMAVACTPNTAYKTELKDPELFQSAVKNLSDIIVYDIFSPPVASRVYMYPTIAAYEIMAQAYPEAYTSLAGQLNGLTASPAIAEEVTPELAALYAYNRIGKTLIFSEDKMEAFQAKLEEKVKDMGVPLSVRKASKAYADQMVEHILAWAKGDLYNQTPTCCSWDWNGLPFVKSNAKGSLGLYWLAESNTKVRILFQWGSIPSI